MTPDISSSFMRFEMTEREQLTSQIFSHENKAYLKNLLADNAEEQLRDLYNPTDPEIWFQAQAKRAGMMEILRFLLEQSLASEEIMNSISQENKDSQ